MEGVEELVVDVDVVEDVGLVAEVAGVCLVELLVACGKVGGEM